MTSTNSLRSKLRSRSVLFASWVSFGHPSIAEIFASQRFDFLAIDMEHSTISLEQAQRIIASSQSFQVPCLPRPVSHSNDWIKPLLDSGADGLIAPLTSTAEEALSLKDKLKFPPVGQRSFGINRAQGYGSDFQEYVKTWNMSSVFIPQIETLNGVKNIESILSIDEVDGVMIGPYDLSGSLGVPGQLENELVVQAERNVLRACQSAGKSCGTQIANFTSASVGEALDKGYNFIVASSDLFVLHAWSISAEKIMGEYRSV